jgi:hypothetical protein
VIADGSSGLGIELPIDIGIPGPTDVPAAHRSVSIAAASCSTTINRSRAWLNRDITGRAVMSETSNRFGTRRASVGV